MSDSLKHLRDTSEAKGGFADSADQSEWTAQKWIWVKDEADTFIAGNITEDKGETYSVRLTNGKVVEINKNDSYKMNPPKFEKVEDMAELAYLNEPAVLDNLTKRYQSNLIYTYSGLFCVVVNPYKRLPIYTPDVVDMYQGKRRQEMPPHVYNIADSAYRNMLNDRENQSILITGESGAGKTENTKKVIQYIAATAAGPDKGKGQLEEQLLQCNPVLEAFGNAKTIKNDNSSRFGKFIRIEFDRSGLISGGNIETYLLEKSRAVRQQNDERTFHIFYQLLHGATPEMRQELLLDSVDAVPFLSDKASSSVEGVDDVAEFAITTEAMRVVGINDADQTEVWRTLSGIMKLGQMKFTQDRSDQAQMPDDTIAAMVCKLFGIPLSDFTKAMLKPRIKVGRDTVTKAQRADQVVSSIEAIAKAIHERTFLWIVKKINAVLDTRRAASSFIGILDIAGFEIFKVNSFEQLCINFTNEKLQQFFNNHMFVVEQEEYKKEGIDWQFINFGLDLQPCIDLIEKPMGVLALLDEECHLMPRSSDSTLVEKMDKAHSGKSDKYRKLGGKIKRDDVGFNCQHYAGEVEYTCDGWLTKNTDPLNDNITALLSQSTNPFTASLWADMVSHDTTRSRRGGSMRTVGQNYRDQLNSLMTTLRNTTPHFVRCIIPNHEKKAGKIDQAIVLDQLRCNGVLEGIRICRKGFPNRILFQDFKQRYEILTPGAVPKGFMDGRKACEKMIEALELSADEFRIGSSKIFFRTGVIGQLEEQRDEKLSAMVRHLQAHCRGLLARRQYRRATNHEVAVKMIQRNCRKYLMLRSWPWWKLFVRVQPLLKVTQEDNLKKELEDAKASAEHSAKREQELQVQFDELHNEKNGLKSDLDRVQNELDSCNDSIDRFQTRSEQLLKEVEGLEDQLEEESSRADNLMTEKKALQAKQSIVEAEMADAQQRAEKLAGEKVSLEEKLSAVETELLSEKDANEKLTKDKASLESQLSTRSEELAAAEEKYKSLSKAKSKGDGSLAEIEERLATVEAERSDLQTQKRKIDAELATLRDRVAELEKQVAQLQAEVERKTAEVAATQEQLDAESEKVFAVQKENRELTSQVESLQEELESEQSALSKLKKEKLALDLLLKELEDRMEDSETSGNAQAEMRAKREEELQGLKTKYEEAQAKHEEVVGELKAKLQAQREELVAEVEQLQRNKSELDKNANALSSEVEALKESLDSEGKSRADSDKKKKSLDAQLSETTSILEETTRQLSETSAKAASLAAEVDALSKSLDEKDQALTKAERDAAQARAKVDDLTTTLEDETRQKLNFQSKLKHAEGWTDEAKEALAECEEEVANRDRQVSSLKGQLDELTNRFRTEQGNAENGEAARKNLMREVEELRTSVEGGIAAQSKLKSTNNRLQGELDDANAAVETAQSEASSALKKAKKFDAQINEQKQLAQESDARARIAEAEASRLGTDVYSLKQQIEDLNEQLMSAKKESSNLKSELEESRNSSNKDAGYVASLEKAKRVLEAQLEEMRTEMEELEDELQQTEDAKVRLEVSFQATKQQLERELAERDDSIEEGRRGLMRQMRDLEEQLDEERRAKSTVGSKITKLEHDLIEAQTSLDMAEKGRDQAAREAKKAVQFVRDLQQENDMSYSQMQDANNQLREVERKAQKYHSENAMLAVETERNEKARRAAELARDEAVTELETLRRDGTGSSETTRRLQADLEAKEEELEELQTELDIATDRARRAGLEKSEAECALSQEKDNFAKVEQKLQTLERANAELRDEVENAEREGDRKYKSKVVPLQTRLASLQTELEGESRKAAEAANKYKRSDRKLKETMRLLEDAEKAAIEHKSNFDRSNAKARNMQAQNEELEMEVGSLRTKNRRQVTEINEANEMAEQLRSQLLSTQSRFGRTARARARSKGLTEDDADMDVDTPSTTEITTAGEE
ncbi:hypothetical protein SARC_01270 [Sphaeroforma arctica JP610]|uniref:Myosin heavy chain n=1 Tax=Sphaeroforma arctica JP610 TaxID=667725 RepID=A0A0L0GCG4_9EUKA|nr:hypothetical protein SARC_01270 [Sphaeroforma arctica JP610]KNC86589.1 hypothetical protein SARC_01270 [Sphaeroforma arctica JP610]|eukprot:XP_014160491.1 hypothetical protein SARC_01270 [Sphaeroforma arctica JP610]